MNIEEMAEAMTAKKAGDRMGCPIRKFCHNFGLTCYEVIEKWLESEVEEDVSTCNKQKG